AGGCSAPATISPTSPNGASATWSARDWKSAMTPSTEQSDPQTPQPGLEPGPVRKLRVAAVGDLHVGEAHEGAHRELFDRVHEAADVLCLCGDLTNFGKPREVELLLADLRGCQIPMVGVLGNHE